MSDMYLALSDPTRRKILQMLAEKEYTQSEIVKSFTISQPAINKHLKILIKEGLVLETRFGRKCFYRLDQTRFEAGYQMIREQIEQILDHKLTRFKTYVENMEGDADGS